MSKPKLTWPVMTLTSGPVDAYPAVLRGLSRPIAYDFDPAFQQFYEDVVGKARTAMRTKDMPVILHGEPVLGLEAAAASLIAKGDVVLNLASGVYGKGFGYWAARYAKEVVEIEVPYNDAIAPGAVEAFLTKRPDVKIVSLCHHDTPSGTINPAREIGAIVARHGALLIVDAVSSFGGMDIHPDDCHAGIFVTGPNKCLGSAPGLSMLSVSSGAWKKMKANLDAPRASMLSILDWENAWRHDHPFPFTPSVAEMNGLDAALDVYLDEGPEAIWKRHDRTARACRAGVRAMGLDLWPVREAIASPTTTAIAVPAGVAEPDWRTAIRTHYGVAVSSGRAETLGKLIRIGHMGPTAQPIYAAVAIAALGGALKHVGKAVDVGAGVAAVMECIDATA